MAAVSATIRYDSNSPAVSPAGYLGSALYAALYMQRESSTLVKCLFPVAKLQPQKAMLRPSIVGVYRDSQKTPSWTM